MTKQEEIRAGIQGWVDKRFGVPNTFNTQLLYDFLVYLDEHDVVIEVKGELPINPFMADVWKTMTYDEAQQDMLKGGYVAVEPLIEEKG